MVAPPKDLVEKTDVDVQEEEILEPLQTTGRDIKHVFLGINSRNQFGPDGSFPVGTVEDKVRAYLEQDYKLVYVQHLRSNLAPEGNQVMSEQMLYVFQRE
jgi:hypothetical protein